MHKFPYFHKLFVYLQISRCIFFIMTTENLLLLAIRAALEAGADIRRIYNNPGNDFDIEYKADNSPLTIADKTSDATIEKHLKSTPYPILTEEKKALPFEERKKWEKLWIVDPLDGTKEFIKRNGEFTVNIALVENGLPTLGVIYVPIKKSLYFGEINSGGYRVDDITDLQENGSFQNLISLSCPLPQPDPQRSYTVVASRSHLSPETEVFINDLRKKHHEIEIVSIGSSLKICLVCEGAADIYPRFAPTMEWDTAAGHAIARATGKNIFHTDRKTPISYNKEDLHNPWFIVE